MTKFFFAMTLFFNVNFAYAAEFAVDNLIVCAHNSWSGSVALSAESAISNLNLIISQSQIKQPIGQYGTDYAIISKPFKVSSISVSKEGSVTMACAALSK